MAHDQARAGVPAGRIQDEAGGSGSSSISSMGPPLFGSPVRSRPRPVVDRFVMQPSPTPFGVSAWAAQVAARQVQQQFDHLVRSSPKPRFTERFLGSQGLNTGYASPRQSPVPAWNFTPLKPPESWRPLQVQNPADMLNQLLDRTSEDPARSHSHDKQEHDMPAQVREVALEDVLVMTDGNIDARIESSQDKTRPSGHSADPSEAQTNGQEFLKPGDPGGQSECPPPENEPPLVASRVTRESAQKALSKFPEPRRTPTKKPPEKSSTPTEKPRTPAEKARTPSEKTRAPIQNPRTPTERTRTPTEKPSTPTEKPSTPTEKPSTPTDAPVENPRTPTEKPRSPVEKTSAPTAVFARPQTRAAVKGKGDSTHTKGSRKLNEENCVEMNTKDSPKGTFVEKDLEGSRAVKETLKEAVGSGKKEEGATEEGRGRLGRQGTSQEPQGDTGPVTRGRGRATKRKPAEEAASDAKRQLSHSEPREAHESEGTRPKTRRFQELHGLELTAHTRRMTRSARKLKEHDLTGPPEASPVDKGLQTEGFEGTKRQLAEALEGATGDTPEGVAVALPSGVAEVNDDAIVIEKADFERGIAKATAEGSSKQKRYRGNRMTWELQSKLADQQGDTKLLRSSVASGLKTTRSGRPVLPCLEFWRNQRKRQDELGRLVVDPGSPDFILRTFSPVIRECHKLESASKASKGLSVLKVKAEVASKTKPEPSRKRKREERAEADSKPRQKKLPDTKEVEDKDSKGKPETSNSKPGRKQQQKEKVLGKAVKSLRGKDKVPDKTGTAQNGEGSKLKKAIKENDAEGQGLKESDRATPADVSRPGKRVVKPFDRTKPDTEHRRKRETARKSTGFPVKAHRSQPTLKDVQKEGATRAGSSARLPQVASKAGRSEPPSTSEKSPDIHDIAAEVIAKAPTLGLPVLAEDRPLETLGGDEEKGGPGVADWTEEQLSALERVQKTLNPKGKNYWQSVAKQVAGKTAADCFSKAYQTSTIEPERPPLSSPPQVHPSFDPAAGTPKVAAQVAARRNVRDILQRQRQAGQAGDAFAAFQFLRPSEATGADKAGPEQAKGSKLKCVNRVQGVVTMSRGPKQKQVDAHSEGLDLRSRRVAPAAVAQKDGTDLGVGVEEGDDVGAGWEEETEDA